MLGGIYVRLINVRKGQFVYYNNKLHKVYSVKPFYKKSVHLIRLSDLAQILTTAKDIELYKPKHLDSFICNHQRYTLDKHAHAKVGDYILVIDPRPDSLDHHYLHAIEMVSTIEDSGVISNKANGIKHHEYWVMEPGLSDGAQKIDRQNPDIKDEEEEDTNKVDEKPYIPKIGDVYQKNDSDPLLQAMVLATEGRTVYLGGGMEVSVSELTDSDKWSLVINVWEQ